MNNSPRYAPPGKFLAEITQRCLQGRYLLRPSQQLNELIAGVVAKAGDKYPVEIVGLAVPSNHYHLLATASNQKDLSSFMNFVASNVAREASRLHGWEGKFWAHRYECIPITDEEEIQVERLKYLLSQGCKEGLVASPRNWPGLNSAEAQMGGTGIPGIWVDRTALYRARRKKGGEQLQPSDFAEALCLELAPLPCWAQLSPEEHQSRIRDLVEEIERETAARHRQEGTQPLGRRAILRQNPRRRSEVPETRPAPRVHAATRAARSHFLEAYRIFLRAYRAAATKLRAGDLSVEFPEGCFPPSRPFVEAGPSPPRG